ncbi:hypothetical protein CLOM_g184 [Closterium sp. NIES-68]|nr:hypothetical protein CLOM_g184 [Closterium sp. NIES-68]GJP68064.1 hypothetical protein CLOP_g24815 [Closterium sp. NIES-67]
MSNLPLPPALIAAQLRRDQQPQQQQQQQSRLVDTGQPLTMNAKTNGDGNDAGSYENPSPGHRPGRQSFQHPSPHSGQGGGGNPPGVSVYSRELKVVPGGVSGMTIEAAGTELSGQIMHNRTASGHLTVAPPSSPLSGGSGFKSRPAGHSLGAASSPVGRPAGRGAAAPPPPPAIFHTALQDCRAHADPPRQLAAARALREMARDHEASRPAMVEAGAVSALLPLLVSSETSPRQQQEVEGSGGGSVRGVERRDGSAAAEAGLGPAGSGCSGEVSRTAVMEEAVTALLNLSIHPKSRTLMPSLGVVSHLVRVAGNAESMSARETAAATLFSLSAEDENKLIIIDEGAVRPLLELLNESACSEQGRRDSCKALFNLSMLSSKRQELIQAGAVSSLLGLLSEPTSSLAEKAMAALSNLASEADGRAAIMGDGEDSDEADGLGALVEVLETGTPRGREFSVAALWLIASNSQEHRRMILGEALLPSLNGLLQTGTPRAREKAKLLLANLRGM